MLLVRIASFRKRFIFLQGSPLSRLLLQSGALTSMATNFEVRLLLELWNFDGVPIGQGKLNKRFSGKAADKNAAREGLMASGSIGVAGEGKAKGFVLTDLGKALLGTSLANDEFKFGIGQRTANVLLKWVRSTPVTSAEPVAKTVGSAIESYEAFKVVALEIYDRLNRDFNMDNLVPIYRIRREIGERVERSEFNEWLLEMQAQDHLQLIGGEMPSITPEIAEDSITTSLGAARYYAKRI